MVETIILLLTLVLKHGLTYDVSIGTHGYISQKIKGTYEFYSTMMNSICYKSQPYDPIRDTTNISNDVLMLMKKGGEI